MKIGNIYKLEEQFFVVLDFDSIDKVYKITFKNLFSGELRTEMFNDSMIEEFCPIILTFKRETKYHYKFDSNGIEYEFIKENINDIIPYLKTNQWPNKKSKPVYIDVYEDNIKVGTTIHLFSKDADKIYYSLNDSEFQVYENDIIITADCILKAYSTKIGYDNSDIATFPFQLHNRTIKIYFSPSRQINNKGVIPEIYPNEKEMMNLLSNRIINNLVDKNVVCYQNNPDLFIKDWLEEGKDKQIDVHFAIHSNASSKHNKKGMETWVHLPTSKTYSFANILYDNLYSIYYDNKNPITNRGVKFANGKIMECNDNYVDFGILLETAYHDNIDDTKWMIDNLDNIANNIANSIIQYFQL